MRTSPPPFLSSHLRILMAAVAVCACALISTNMPVGAQTFSVDRVQRATVYVMQVYSNSLGQAVISCVGSGTLVSADGLILTNAHNALPSDTCRSDRIVIGLTIHAGEAPVATYNAVPVETNVGWDLAVLRVTTTLDGRTVDRSSLALPFVPIGDSEATTLDDTINVVGFVAGDQQGNTTNQVVRATISGYTAEAGVGDRAWIKTSAAIPGTMSGGGAYDLQGNLIGIPTIEPARSSGSTLDCRQVQDTNGDGHVDNNDSCIPVSGFINALRPSRLARGLVLAANLGISAQIKAPTQSEPQSSDPPSFSRLFFSPGINAAGMPTGVVTGMPAGTTRLYLFFDYNNMRDGMIYELRTTLDGVPDPTFSLAPATWSGGSSGLWYIGSTAQTWPNGTYDFSLFIEGVRSASAQITLGGPARSDPTFSDILFGILDQSVGPSGILVSTGNVLPIANTINAQFVYNNMTPGLPWREDWYYQGLKVSESQATWKDGPNGKLTINATATDKPLQPGRYRLELYLGDTLAATSDFIMAGAETAQKADLFDNFRFATDLKNDQPAGIVGTTFSQQPQHLYAAFDWHALGTNMPWTWRWSVDGNPLFEVTQPWGDAPDGSAFWLALNSNSTLPDGSYKAELLVSGQVITSATAKVGLGQLPVTTFGQASGVQVQGQITDADTGKGIPNVTFIVLKTDFTAKEFNWDMSEVYDLSYTDSEGRFTLSKLLTPTTSDLSYSMIVMARGYLPILADPGLSIIDKTQSPLVLNIQLNRD